MEKERNIINDWLDQNGNPETEKFISKNLAITEKVCKALETKGWTKAQFAKEMGKKPSEVSKWLSGMHNITFKSIIKMEATLGIDLIQVEPIKETEYVFLGVISGQKDFTEKSDAYTEMHEFNIAM